VWVVAWGSSPCTVTMKAGGRECEGGGLFGTAYPRCDGGTGRMPVLRPTSSPTRCPGDCDQCLRRDARAARDIVTDAMPLLSCEAVESVANSRCALLLYGLQR
jgi:hypothetical protein